jgi:hypothetical protein
MMKSYTVRFRVVGYGEYKVDAHSEEEAWDTFSDAMENEDEVRDALDSVEIDYQDVEIDRDYLEEEGANDY